MGDSRMAATCDGIMAHPVGADVARSQFFAMSVTGTKRKSAASTGHVRNAAQSGQSISSCHSPLMTQSGSPRHLQIPRRAFTLSRISPAPLLLSAPKACSPDLD